MTIYTYANKYTHTYELSGMLYVLVIPLIIVKNACLMSERKTNTSLNAFFFKTDTKKLMLTLLIPI